MPSKRPYQLNDAVGYQPTPSSGFRSAFEDNLLRTELNARHQKPTVVQSHAAVQTTDCDALDDLPLHFQVTEVREAAAATCAEIRSVPDAVTFELFAADQAVEVTQAVMPVTVTADPGRQRNDLDRRDNSRCALLQSVRAPMILKIHSDFDLEVLKPLIVPPRSTQSVEIGVLGDATFGMFAILVQEPLAVKKVSLIFKESLFERFNLKPMVSTRAFATLLKALCHVPESSKLQVLEIPTDVREIIVGDPVAVVDAMNECRSNSTAARILQLEPTSIPKPVMETVPKDDFLTLWLPTSGIESFNEQTAFRFPRKRLVESSQMISNLLKDNPGEDTIPLPLHKLGQRSVSAAALSVTAQLLLHCPCIEVPAGRMQQESEAAVDTEDVEAETDPATRADLGPVWTAEFQEVYEAAFLPLLEDSDIPAFRRQLALKLFGEILELGRYLELRVAYEFGLVGGVAMFARRLTTGTH